MRIHHVALWVNDLELMKEFYQTAFGAVGGPNYRNEQRGFESSFLRFDGGAQLELMTLAGLAPRSGLAESCGYAHLALAVPGRSDVAAMKDRLAALPCILLSGPRETGDGYYELAFRDPEGNVVEIVAEHS